MDKDIDNESALEVETISRAASIVLDWVKDNDLNDVIDTWDTFDESAKDAYGVTALLCIKYLLETQND